MAPPPAAPAASMEELRQLGAVLAGLGDKPRELLGRIAMLTRFAVGARGAIVVVDGAVATSGEAVDTPVLSASLALAAGMTGQLAVGERQDGPYSPADAEKLKHYAAVVSHILDAASRLRESPARLFRQRQPDCRLREVEIPALFDIVLCGLLQPADAPASASAGDVQITARA